MAVDLSPPLAPPSPARRPRSTGGLPFVGSLPALLRDPLPFFLEARQRYGDIYTLDLGVTRMTVLNHPSHAQHILADNSRNYPKGGAMWDSIRSMLGNGLVVSEGDFWLRQRRMMQPHFHHKRLAAISGIMVGAIEESLQTWDERLATGAAVDLAPAFSAITMNVIVRTLFGSQLDEIRAGKVGQAMGYALDYLMVGMLARSLPAGLPVPGKRRYAAALKTMDAVLFEVIAGRRAAGLDGDDLIALLIQAVDDESGEGMTNQQLRDEAVTMFLAGYETTSITLSWVMHFLLHDPSVARQLRDEADAVLDGRAPTFADLPRLTYTRMVIQEALRFFPPSWWTPRTAQRDDEVDGFAIPAGTNVVSLTYGIHHHPGIWDQPHLFVPERFSPEQVA
ncbi:MAG TPA: cytochrome P450, partial [Herpetosiphonaceae bacterium]|nr:cytochrome P450 [Herpetosiphonaceae bacterium]